MLKEGREDGPFAKIKELQETIDSLRNALDQPNKEYQEYLKEKAEWEAKLETIIGDELTSDTKKYYAKQLSEIDRIPTDLEAKKQSRLEKVFEIHNQLSELRDEYGSLYKPVKDFIDTHEFAKKDRFSMDFRVAILCEGFLEPFFNYIGQNKRGSFYGADDGRKKLRDIIDSSSFDTSSYLKEFLEKIEMHLCCDKREGFSNEKRYIADQLRQDAKIDSFYDFIYSLDYLKPKYILQWAGKDLDQLSPGERGTVLLIFYLFISQEDKPLVIDQPEHNLDNETVYGVLRPCIKLAINRRQIIIVTHNPNLAVVCDADQVIHCEMKKEEKNKITYTCGAIENPMINKALIDILEGTRPAFDKRGSKYYAE
jgi:DNA repair exonuclease SbcCD ATPase subunit